MTRSRARSPVLAAALALLAAACTVGPDYEPPDFTVETVPDQWRTTVETEMAADTTDLEMWWVSFNDSLLTELIKRSEFGNLDLQAAVGRVAEARAIRGVAKGGYWPDIVLGGSRGPRYRRTTEREGEPVPCSPNRSTRGLPASA
jgi:outer membrane protein TolC